MKLTSLLLSTALTQQCYKSSSAFLLSPSQQQLHLKVHRKDVSFLNPSFRETKSELFQTSPASNPSTNEDGNNQSKASSATSSTGNNNIVSSLSTTTSASSSSLTAPATPSSSPLSASKAILEAQELLRKAKELKAEAAKEELELKAQKQSKQTKQNSEADIVIDALLSFLDMNMTNVYETATDTNSFDKATQFQQTSQLPPQSLSSQTTSQALNVEKQNNPNQNKDLSSIPTTNPPTSMATAVNSLVRNIPENKSITNFLRNKSFSLSKMQNVIQRIYEREVIARGEYNKKQQNPGQTNNPTFMIGDVKNTNLVYNPKQAQALMLLTDLILTSQSVLDTERVVEREQKMSLSKSMDSTSNLNNNSITSSASSNIESAVSMATTNNNEIVMAPTLRARVKELRRADRDALQRRLAAQYARQQRMMAGDRSYNTMDMNVFVQNTFNTTNANVNSKGGNNFNVSKFMMEIMAQPMWVPSSMLGYVISCRDEISREDLNLFRTEIVQKCKNFYCTSWDCTNVAAIYRGNIQGNTTAEEVWANLNQLLESYDGDSKLKERIQLFWMDDPEWRKGEDERYPKPKPVIFVTGGNVNPVQARENGLATKVVMSLSVLSSVFTTFAYGIACYALNPVFFNSIVNDKDPSVFASTLPIFFGVLFLQFIHEIAHVVSAKQSNIAIGLPVPLPSLEIGTFGSITPLRSFPPTRTQLFDFALSGPAITLFLSMVLSVIGINLTIQTPTDVLTSLPVVPVALFKSSFLTGSFVSILAPKIMALPLSQTVPIHPLFLIGLTGLVSSSLNLLPIGRLDGGRVVSALFGRRVAYPLSILTLFFLAIASLTGTSHITILFGLLVTVFQRQPEIQVRDEVTDVKGGEGWRLGVYAATMFLVGLILFPFPGGSPL